MDSSSACPKPLAADRSVTGRRGASRCGLSDANAGPDSRCMASGPAPTGCTGARSPGPSCQRPGIRSPMEPPNAASPVRRTNPAEYGSGPGRTNGCRGTLSKFPGTRQVLGVATKSSVHVGTISAAGRGTSGPSVPPQHRPAEPWQAQGPSGLRLSPGWPPPAQGIRLENVALWPRPARTSHDDGSVRIHALDGLFSITKDFENPLELSLSAVPAFRSALLHGVTALAGRVSPSAGVR
jgi:hypothetical protein